MKEGEAEQPSPGAQADAAAIDDLRNALIPIPQEEDQWISNDARLQGPASEPGHVFPGLIMSHLGPARNQIDSGSKWLKRHQRIMEDTAKQEKYFSKLMHTVVQTQRNKIAADESTEIKRDKMIRMWNVQMSMYASIETVAALHGEFARSVDDDLAKPLAESLRESQNRIKAVYKDAESALKTLNAALQKVKKCKRNADAMIKSRDAAIVREKKESESSGKGTKRKNFLARMTESLSGSVSQNEAKVKAARQAYDEAIGSYNEVKRLWEEQQIVKIISDLEMIERDRLQVQKAMSEKLVVCFNAQAAKYSSLAQEFQSSVSQLDPERDIKGFALRIENEYGPSTFSEPLRDEIVEWEAGVTSEEDVVNIFSQNLNDILAAQKEHYPELTVPYILPYLVDEINKYDGFKQEGIFRVPASGDQIGIAKRKIIAGEAPDFADPFVPADLLKSFVKELPENLFGSNYSLCIELAKNEDSTYEQYREFYSKLRIAPESKAVLDFIFNMIIQYSTAEFVESSKMTLHNYAIVFAPSLLHSSRDDDTDSMNSIQNAPYETLFVHKLVYAIAQYDIVPTTESSPAFRGTSSFTVNSASKDGLEALDEMQLKTRESETKTEEKKE